MDLKLLHVDELAPDPANPRAKLFGIAELAASIDEYGLLQNLVAVQDASGAYHLRAGHRRHAALKLLVEQGKHPGQVPVIIIDGTGKFEALIENVQRENLQPWAVGRKFMEFRDAGITTAIIAAKLSVSQGYINARIRMAEFIAPEVIDRLNKLGPNHGITLNTLLRIAGAYNAETFEPDTKIQMAMVERALAVPCRVGRGRVSPVNEKSRVYQRYLRLKKGAVRVSSKHARVIDQIVRWLSGEIARLELD